MQYPEMQTGQDGVALTRCEGNGILGRKLELRFSMGTYNSRVETKGVNEGYVRIMSIQLIEKYYSEVEKLRKFGGSSMNPCLRGAFQ
jgi:hypothetical protein